MPAHVNRTIRLLISGSEVRGLHGAQVKAGTAGNTVHTVVLKLLTAVLAAAALALTVAPAAQADQYSYVSYLDNRGVYYGSILDVIEDGKQTCQALRYGTSVNDVMATLEQWYAVPEVAFIVIGAAQEMCPDMMPTVRAFANGQ